MKGIASDMATTMLTRTDARPRASKASFPGPQIWEHSAPQSVTSAGEWWASSEGWRAWQRHLATRSAPESLERLLKSRRSPLLWGAGSLSLESDSRDLLTTLSRAAQGHRAAGQAAAEIVEHWLAESEGNLLREPAALESLAWAYALQSLAAFAAAPLWWELLQLLINGASEARRPAEYESPLSCQVWEAELPLVLATLLPEILPCHALGSAGARRLGESLAETASDDELLAPRSFRALRARLASWTRSLVLARQRPHFAADEAATKLGRVLLAALRARRANGRQLFESDDPADGSAELFEAALAQVGDPQLKAVASPPRGRVKKRSKKKIAAPPLPACHSENAGLALLRRTWSADGEMFGVRYDGGQVQCELSCGRHIVLSGCWCLELEADGKPLERRSDWDHVCWVSDKDVDYLEIEARFTGGVRVQRQMLLAREDRLLCLADAVLGQTDCRWHYQSMLAYTADVQVTPAEDTRELTLLAGRRRMSALPLALPEWRRDPRGGTLAASDGELRLSQQCSGRRMYAPLLIDLDPRRARKALTWRQLTVAEDRKTLPADMAVGYRVQLARQQWLIYRSLGEQANRTVLGSNLVTEFLLARFSSDGEVQPLLEIE